VLTGADSGNANILSAQSATLAKAATIQSLSFYVTAASGQLALGIYDASGLNGGPGALKAAAYLTPTTGWNTAKVAAPVLLPAGAYWLAFVPSTNALSFRKTSAAGNCKYYGFKYNALPSKFSTSPASCTPTTWSFYATATVSSTGFSTTFPATENPISQGGLWTNGGTTGISWGNVGTVGGSPGRAYGVSAPSLYADPTAILSALKLNNDQQASAKIFVTGPSAAGEVEVRLRTNISARSITGYELYCSVTASDPYVAITKWEGPLGRWYTLLQYKGSAYACPNGTVLKGTVQGNPPVLTLYLNGVQKARVTDTGKDGFPVWTSGYAGMGFWGGNPFSAFGFNSFTASNYP